MQKFKNTNEIIRATLHSLEEKSKIAALKNAIEEGVGSGLTENFNAKKHLQNLKAAKRKNG